MTIDNLYELVQNHEQKLIQETQKDNTNKDITKKLKKQKKESKFHHPENDELGDFNRYINKLNKIADKCEIF